MKHIPHNDYLLGWELTGRVCTQANNITTQHIFESSIDDIPQESLGRHFNRFCTRDLQKVVEGRSFGASKFERIFVKKKRAWIAPLFYFQTFQWSTYPGSCLVFEKNVEKQFLNA